MSYLPRESIISVLEALGQIRRPRLLLRTARFGLAEYDRQRDLRRVMRLPASPAPGIATVRALIELEARHEAQRIRPPSEVGDTWRAARHVEILICLIAESRLLAEAVPIHAPYLESAGSDLPMSDANKSDANRSDANRSGANRSGATGYDPQQPGTVPSDMARSEVDGPGTARSVARAAVVALQGT